MSNPAQLRFTWIPKNGGTSIEQTLTAAVRPAVWQLQSVWRFDGFKVLNHGHCAGLGLPRSVLPFGVCRDPYSRAVSLYHASHLGHVAQGVTDFTSFCRRLADGLQWRVTPYRFNLLRPQIDYVDDRCRVLRFESLADDWREFSAGHGLPENLQHQKQTQATKQRDWRSYYTDETRAQVARFYAADFERFGYPVGS